MQTLKKLQKASLAGLILLALSACGGRDSTPTFAPVPPTEDAVNAQAPPPETAAPSPTSRESDMGTAEEVAGRITWLHSSNMYGNTGIKLETGGKVIYLDPAELKGVENLPKADVILVTHPHVDHFSVQTIAALTKEGTIVVSIQQVGYLLSGVEFTSMAPGETADAGGLELRAVAAYNHDHPKELGYLGFVFSVEGVRIYCSGDTGLIPEMGSLSGIDIAVLNIRKTYSLSGKDAVAFAGMVSPKIVIPIHWMPDDVSFGDLAEMDYLRSHMPDGTKLLELELTP
jgi:L-ascorbate metabolism protein UlaG (beta-lactamase superfamily)